MIWHDRFALVRRQGSPCMIRRGSDETIRPAAKSTPKHDVTTTSVVLPSMTSCKPRTGRLNVRPISRTGGFVRTKWQLGSCTCYFLPASISGVSPHIINAYVYKPKAVLSKKQVCTADMSTHGAIQPYSSWSFSAALRIFANYN